ncbi:MAG TPA: hypothetical protein VGL03_09665 [Thermoanaerobaculia bacterium]|jgi:hypothetical protein
MDDLRERHLTDAELFGLAVPAAGDPEALPGHLSQCQACSRALSEWKNAVQTLAEEDLGALGRRSPEQWRAAEDSTMEAIRRAGRPRRAAHPIRWIVGIAAALLIVALAMPARKSAPAAGAVKSDDTTFSAADRADDALLRDAAFLAQGGDTGTDSIAEDSL